MLRRKRFNRVLPGKSRYSAEFVQSLLSLLLCANCRGTPAHDPKTNVVL